MSPGTHAPPDLSVRIGGLVLRNPVMLASGTAGWGREYDGVIDYSRIGALVTKGLSVTPRQGNLPPRIAETAAGMLNTIGLENPGLAGFFTEKLPFMSGMACPVIVNVFGHVEDEFVRLAEALDPVDARIVPALEVNVSCPNIQAGGVSFAQDPETSHRVVRRVRAATGKVLLVKLTPQIADITAVARAVAEAGADALSVINSVPAMAVDLERRRPLLGHGSGGLTGPAIKPIALHHVYRCARAVRIPIVGIGGIATWRDAAEFLCAGATAVQVGTATFARPQAAEEIVVGLAQYLARQGMARVAQLRMDDIVMASE